MHVLRGRGLIEGTNHRVTPVDSHPYSWQRSRRWLAAMELCLRELRRRAREENCSADAIRHHDQQRQRALVLDQRIA